MGWSKLKCSSCKVRVVRTRRRRVESMQGLATCWYHGYPYSLSFITIGNWSGCYKEIFVIRSDIVRAYSFFFFTYIKVLQLSNSSIPRTHLD